MKNMNKTVYLVLSFFLISFFLIGCGNKIVEDNNTDKAFASSDSDNLESVDNNFVNVVLEDTSDVVESDDSCSSSDCEVPDRFEVMLRSDYEKNSDSLLTEYFFPSVIKTTVGSVVSISLSSDNIHFVSLPEFDVAQKVKNDVLTFVAKEKGVYDLICDDCLDNAYLTVIVD